MGKIISNSSQVWQNLTGMILMRPSLRITQTNSIHRYRGSYMSCLLRSTVLKRVQQSVI